LWLHEEPYLTGYKKGRTLVYKKASSAVHSDLDVGFESAKTIGNCKTYPTQRIICDLVTSGEYIPKSISTANWQRVPHKCN
jgi:hypothetical protein